MDSKEIKSLMEAYAEVYAPKEEVNEAVKGASPHAMQMRKDAAAERKLGMKDRLSASKGRANVAKMERDIKFYDKISKAKKHMPGYTYAEGVEIFDIVLQFLQAEGIAETIEEAKWAMANILSKEEIDIIVEAMHEDEDEEEEEDKKEVKKEKKGKKEKEEEDEEENIKEATYSAKAARAGKDIGKPGKMFAKIAASAGKRYGSKERGEKVAGAVLAKLRAKKG